MRNHKQWAEKLSRVLTHEEFNEFATFMDVCNDVEFYGALAEIDAERNPHLYVGTTHVANSEIDAKRS